VPGWYGMASVKWLKKIEALAEPFFRLSTDPNLPFQRKCR